MKHPLLALDSLPLTRPAPDWNKKNSQGFILNQKNLAFKHSIEIRDKALIFKYANALQKKGFVFNEMLCKLIETLYENRGSSLEKDHFGRKTVTPELDGIKKSHSKKRYDIRLKRLKTIEYFNLDVSTRFNTKLHQFGLILKKISWIRHRKVFFRYKVCYRGRKYPEGFLGLTSMDFVRSLYKADRSITLRNINQVKDLISYGASFFKKSFLTREEKLSFILENKLELKKIIDTRFAKNPLEATLKTKDIFSFFAWLLELHQLKFFLTDDLEQILGKKTNFLLRIDCHASSLQHIAALISSKRILKQLNFEKPEEAFYKKDIYDSLVNDFKAFLEKNTSRKNLLSRIESILNRKFIKEKVMITFYGVTAKGLRQRFEEDIKTLFSEDSGKKKAITLYRLFIKFLKEKYNELFIFLKGIQNIVEWRLKNEPNLKALSWSPDKDEEVTIKQEYCQLKKMRFKLHFLGEEKSLRLTIFEPTESIDLPKTKRAIAANLIQSLDAMIMRRLYENIKKRGLSEFFYGDVHDAVVFLPQRDMHQSINEAYGRAMFEFYGTDCKINLLNEIFGDTLLKRVLSNTLDNSQQAKAILAFHKQCYSKEKLDETTVLLKEAIGNPYLLS